MTDDRPNEVPVLDHIRRMVTGKSDRRYRTFIVTVYDEREQKSYDLEFREYTVAYAKLATKRAGWRHILGVRERG